jgi:arsenate reductase (glutaredoxin)
MKATIYHNPMCGTSRKTLEILRDSGCDVWIHEYISRIRPRATN